MISSWGTFKKRKKSILRENCGSCAVYTLCGSSCEAPEDPTEGMVYVCLAFYTDGEANAREDSWHVHIGMSSYLLLS